MNWRKSIKWLVISFLFFRMVSQGYQIDDLKDQLFVSNWISSEVIDRLEIQYRFTEKVMKRVNFLERRLGVDKQRNRSYLKSKKEIKQVLNKKENK